MYLNYFQEELEKQVEGSSLCIELQIQDCKKEAEKLQKNVYEADFMERKHIDELKTRILKQQTQVREEANHHQRRMKDRQKT